MWLTQLLRNNVQCRRDVLAIVDGELTVTWGQFDDAVSKLATGLGSRFDRGDRVGVISTDRYEVLLTYFALARIGAVFAPINRALAAPEVAALIEATSLAGLVGERALIDPHLENVAYAVDFDSAEFAELCRGRAEESRTAVHTDDLAAIVFTSATTGTAKGVAVDYRSIQAISLGWLAVTTPGDEAVLVNCCPLSHGGVVVTFTYMAAGATIVLLRGFSPQQALAAVERYDATHLWLVPQMLKQIVDSPACRRTDLGGLREILYGAAPMPPDLYTSARESIPCGYRQVYGMTEAGGPFCTLAPAEHPETATQSVPSGRVIPSMQLRVVAGGYEATRGEVGEIQIRGDGVMRGYWNNPGATAERFDGDWVKTGDLGWIDTGGFVHLIDRIKDVIIRGGQNVYPAEIENALRAHPAVADVGAVGIGDGTWGEVPVAFVVRASTVSESELLTHLVRNLASYKRPQQVRFVDEIPRNGAGKILRRVLRQSLEASSAGESR